MRYVIVLTLLLVTGCASTKAATISNPVDAVNDCGAYVANMTHGAILSFQPSASEASKAVTVSSQTVTIHWHGRNARGPVAISCRLSAPDPHGFRVDDATESYDAIPPADWQSRPTLHFITHYSGIQ